jgi:hypothetical protein
MPVKSPSKAVAKAPKNPPVKAAPKVAVKSPAKAAAASKPTAAAKQNATDKKAVAAPVKPAAKTAPKAADAPREKARKPKLVRDSFTMPEAEYQVLVDLKKACIKAGFEVKKSELLRVGVALMQQADTAKLKQILATLPALKAGRPSKAK